MTVAERIRICKLSNEMKKQKEFSKSIGLEDKSKILRKESGKNNEKQT